MVVKMNRNGCQDEQEWLLRQIKMDVKTVFKTAYVFFSLTCEFCPFN